jgi:glutaryl-CoA dehydrogenase
MKTFEAPDFMQIDELLSSEERQVRDTIRSFVSAEVIPIIDECFMADRFPRELVPKLAELGVFGPTIEGYGCAGLNSTSYGLIMQELERGDSGLRSFVSVQSSLCMHPISKFGTDEHKKKYLPKMARGELIGCFGLTEPDFGSNPAGLTTRARKDGSDYILNGTKMWITSGSIADLAIVWAKVAADSNQAGSPGKERIHGFIVEKGTPGFTAKDIHKKFSLRASITSELSFQDCRVPASQMLNVVGLKGPVDCLFNARFGISYGVIGAAMACYDEALQYSKTRIQFDKPIASFQLVQAKLVKMFNEITQAQLLAWRLGRLKDENRATVQQVSMAKMNNVAMALRIARECRDILGGSGITHEYQCGRHMLNLESVSTYEGTDDIHRLILGEHITGIAAFK